MNEQRESNHDFKQSMEGIEEKLLSKVIKRLDKIIELQESQVFHVDNTKKISKGKRSRLFEDNMTVTERIEIFRKMKGINQREIGDRIGVPQSNYSRFMKKGDNISIKMAREIAKVLDIDFIALIQG